MSKRNTTEKMIDIRELRARLARSQGREYWRSLEELADSAEFQEILRYEFPAQADTWTDPVGRRRFLQLMGASLALAGVTSCTIQPQEKLVPYVREPEDLIPGRPLYFATAMPLDGFGQALVVESHDGRPTKIEGNPKHSASLGAATLLAQASILDLYDPDRLKVIQYVGRVKSWGSLAAELKTQMEEFRIRQGTGLHLLSGTVTSPTLASQFNALLAELPKARWHQYEAGLRDGVQEGGRLAFDRYIQTLYRFDQADVVVSLDADFLFSGPAAVRYTKDFSARRRVEDEHSKMNRFFMVESSPTVSGAMADHRLPLQAAGVLRAAQLLARQLGLPTAYSGLAPSADLAAWVSAAAADLQANRGRSLVIAGDHLPAWVHALVQAINESLGNFGTTVVHTEPVEASPGSRLDSLKELVRWLEAGEVETLIILGGNPVYDAPVDLNFATNLQKARLRVHLTSHLNETTELCQWAVPESHYLEAWSDVRAFDGTISIIQPLIEPLYSSKSAHELLSALSGAPARSGLEIVREHHQNQAPPSSDFAKSWQRYLNEGAIPGSALPSVQVQVNRRSVEEAVSAAALETSGDLELNFRLDPSIYDGRFANNGWLQELPRPLTKLTWDNAVLVSPATAESLSLSNGDLVELTFRGRTLQGPVWIQPGHPSQSVTVHLGYGRRQVGRVGRGTGFNAYSLRTSDAPWFGEGLQIRKTGNTYSLVSTQQHHSMEGRQLVRVGKLEEFRQHPHFAQEMGHEPPADLTLYPKHEYSGYAWGLVVDLNACIGCNACVVACQAENNIPVVGKEEVGTGREMHWIRIDRYYSADLDNPQVFHQPVMCQHCENAPCEPVCPVGATVHSDEGLNDMVYNRCVGTRYCSNNCPYKVRRFNFLLYSDWNTPTLKLQRNPDVTVRSRGVMEKCTYCVQRINQARIASRLEDRKVRDGEIQTACQQTCPADAIVFGDVNDPESRVSRLKAGPRNYSILADLNTVPRTSYLAKLRNPSPHLEVE